MFAIITSKQRNKFNHFFGLSKNETIFKLIQIITTFSLCAFAWIFFRANNVQDAFTIVKKISSNLSSDLFIKWDVFFGVFIGLTILLLKEFREEYLIKKLPIFKNTSFRLLIYALLIVLILLFGVFDSGQFIYFQF